MQLMLFVAVFFLLFNGYTNAEAYYTTTAGGVGAAYTMSDGAPNQILVHRLATNGKISFVRAVNTGGNGANYTAVDALNSQGSIQVYLNYLFVVNAGSNSLSMFVICPWDATQIELISVKPTYGTYPVSVTVNDKYACVITGGNVTGVSCFTYNSTGLLHVPSLDRDTTSFVSQTLPPTPPFNTISQILFSHDNRALIISAITKSFQSNGYLLFFFFNSARTELSARPVKSIPPGALGPVGMINIGNDGLLVTDSGRNGVYTLTYSSSTGAISHANYTPISSIPMAFVCWVAYSPTLGSYYISVPGISTMYELRVTHTSTSNSARVVRAYPIANTTGLLELVVVTLLGKDYLYTIGIEAHVISGYELKAVGQAIAYTRAVSQRGNTSTIPKLAGLAAYVQTRPSSNQYSRCRPAKSCFAKRGSYFDCN